MLYGIGKVLVEVSESRRGVFLFGLSSGVLIGALQLGITRLTNSIQISEPALFQAFCIGVFAAVVAWIESAAVRQRRLRVVSDVATIAELNHHVRNALQAIQYAVRIPAGDDQIHIIEDGVHRIDQTLRTLFLVVTGEGSRSKRSSRLP